MAIYGVWRRIMYCLGTLEIGMGRGLGALAAETAITMGFVITILVAYPMALGARQDL